MSDKIWQTQPASPASLAADFPELNRIILQLLFNRGLIERQAIDDFLNPEYERQILDPFLFKDMAAAVERLFAAADKGERVLIYGDYDADGVSSSAILFFLLKSLGLEPEVQIPFRDSEGYGLNPKIAAQIAAQNFSLVITVDCGVSNWQEIEFFKEKNIDTIVLDHHEEPLKRPTALALINPSLADSGYPFKSLCGGGVAFKFAQAVMQAQQKQNRALQLPAGFDKWLLDLAAIATVGDVCPLLGENRVLVKYGLMVLNKTRRLGLKKLIEKTNHFSGEVDATYLSWRIVPRLNAAGRIDHASAAFNLLTAESESEAEKLVEILETNNQKRQKITEEILRQATEQIETDLAASNGALAETAVEIAAPTARPSAGEQKILIVCGDNWPAGVVGLAAGRLCDKYHRPVLAFGREKIAAAEKKDGAIAEVEVSEQDKFVGSGRSPAEFDITAALKECQEFITRFGGHKQACGLTIMGEKNFNGFKKKIFGLAAEKLKDLDLRPILEAEAEVKLNEINWQLWSELEKFQPFGEANPQPLFLARALKIERLDAIGKDSKHLRLAVSQDDPQTAKKPDWQKIIGFSFGEWAGRLKVGDKVDIVFELGVNEWQGNRELQLKIIDLRPADSR